MSTHTERYYKKCIKYHDYFNLVIFWKHSLLNLKHRPRELNKTHFRGFKIRQKNMSSIKHEVKNWNWVIIVFVWSEWKRAPTEQWKWKGLCENVWRQNKDKWEEQLVDPPIDYLTSVITLLSHHLLAIDLFLFPEGKIKLSLVKFIRMLKTVIKLVTGCLKTMKSCHICIRWLKVKKHVNSLSN